MCTQPEIDYSPKTIPRCKPNRRWKQNPVGGWVWRFRASRREKTKNNCCQELPNVVSVCSNGFIDQVNFLFDVNALQTNELGETAIVRIRSVRF